MKKPFFTGMKDGIPIALGYLSVSFGFGILAIFYSTGSLPTAIVGTAVALVLAYMGKPLIVVALAASAAALAVGFVF